MTIREAIATAGSQVNLDGSNIEAFSQNGIGANATVDAAGSVTASNITAFGNTGNVTI